MTARSILLIALTFASLSGAANGDQKQVGRVDLDFVGTYAGRVPDAFMIEVRLKDGDAYKPDLESSYYIDERGKKTIGLNIIEQNYDQFKFYGYDKRHYILTVPKPVKEIGHFFHPGHHEVTFWYVLNGHRRKATDQCTIYRDGRWGKTQPIEPNQAMQRTAPRPDA